MRRTSCSPRSTRTTMPAAGRLAALISVAGAIAACGVDEPTALGPEPTVSLAKAPPPAVTVTATDPTYGFQGDSVLVVHVKGSGFSAGARTSWPINGDTTHVHEISTTYVSATEVVSTIKVDGDAPPAAYDVVVTLVNGKKGVGAELFTVKPGNERQQPPIPIAVTVDDAGPVGPYSVRSDGLGDYVDGQAGMLAIIDQFGNLQITPQNGNGTTPAQRSLVFDFSQPASPSNTYHPDVSGQINFKILSISYGAPARIQDLGMNGNPVAGCYRVTFAFRNLTTHHQLEFNTSIDAGATLAYITRTSASTWTMVSDGPCGANANWGAVRSQDLTRKNPPLVFRGDYIMRFSVRFQAL
jgi:hypothetical protein